jgi:hypothetical protein
MADSIIERNGQFPILKTLNFFSSRFFSFTVSVGREGFINPFFRLLDSPNKSAKMS